MAQAPKPMFDIFTGAEACAVERAMDAVGDREWAKPIVADIKAHGGLIGSNMDKFFELRCGHALELAGASPHYEVAGEGDSTLDFGFVSKGKSWAVELMRLNETVAAKAATVELDDDGIAFVKRVLSTGGADPRQSCEGETLKTIQRICQKCENDGKPHKFPPPDGAYHAILVDVRTYLNGGDVWDRVHIGLATEKVPYPPLRYFWDQKPITGVFDPRTRMKGAAKARERVHFLGFVKDRTYNTEEFGSTIDFIGNPNLFKSSDDMNAAMATWPLQPARLINSLPG
jgi:hypothetical protein